MNWWRFSSTGAPATNDSSQRVWTKEAPKNLGRSNTAIHVTVGAPIHVAPDDDPAEVTEVLRERMSEQLLAQQEAYPQLTGTEIAALATGDFTALCEEITPFLTKPAPSVPNAAETGSE